MAQMMGNNEAIMKDPAKGLAPMRLNAMESINQRYAGAGDRITANLAKRGYASSGKAPGAFTGIEMARLGDFSDLESKFADIGSQRQMQASGMIQQMIQSMIGSTSTGTGGGGVGAGLQAGGSELGSLSSMMMLGDMLKGRSKPAATPYDMYAT